MSYEQAMSWQKKHPNGGKAQYMGFDTSDAPKIKTEAEIRLFHQTEYRAYHLKNNTDKNILLSENDYVKHSLKNQHQALTKWNKKYKSQK